jgi:rare lipoprotein A
MATLLAPTAPQAGIRRIVGKHMNSIFITGPASLVLLWVTAGSAVSRPHAAAARHAAVKPVAHESIDHSGRKQEGRASFYAPSFTNRRMADGARFNPNSNMAASRTLPLGTTAKVTNLQNGRSALVQVLDRGPHAHGRIMDVAPKVADQLGMKKAGEVPVLIAPIVVSQPDGALTLGVGAAEVSPREVAAATRTAEAASR